MTPGTIRVLYVDDEPDLLEIGKLYLETEGAFTVDTLMSGEQALEQLKTERYDVIISDYQMPGMDGIQFLKQLKAQGNATPFIIFTGRGREVVVIEAYNEGADFYLQKGGEPRSLFAELSNKIRHAVTRKQAEEALRVSEARYRSVVNDQTEMIARFTPEGVITFVNEAYRSYFTALLDFPDVEGKNIHTIMQIKNYSEVEKFLHSLTRAAPLSEMERAFTARDGNTHWQTWSVRALFGPDDDPVEYQVVGRDITDRKRVEEELLRKNEELGASYEQIAATEEELRANLDELTRQELALRESETRYHHFFKTTLDSVFITTPDGKWIDGNDALVETLGYESQAELFVVPVALVYARPKERSAFLELVARDGYVKEHPTQFRKKDGTIFDALMTIMPQRNPDGSLKAFIGTVRVLLMEKRVEALPADPESFSQKRAENIRDYIIVYGPEGKILYINPAAASALGYDAETLAGTPVLSYVAEKSRDSMTATMIAHREKGEVPLYEIDLVARDGFLRSVMVKGTRIQYNNHPATLLFLIDITRKKALEDQLTARAAELFEISTAFQQANKKLNLLSTITRHDISNQLTVLIGYLGLLESEQLDPRHMTYCRNAVTAAERILSMIRFTREYENIGISAPAWQEIRSVVDAAVRDAPLGKVIVKNELPGDMELFADPLIFKVFYNLMDNAVRYGGKITTIRFFVSESGDDPVIVCEDDGVGVASAEKKQIFERGFGKNTGLGLALSQEILSITGITIAETGEPGKGARFEMRIPKNMWRAADMNRGLTGS